MLTIADTIFKSRLFLGTGKFSSIKTTIDSIKASKSELVTLAMRRLNLKKNNEDNLLLELKKLGVKLLPNTSGAKNSKEAIFAANLAREALSTNWIKLEIHPDPRYLLPDPIETFKAAKELIKDKFIVLPYCNADPVLCLRLEEIGCSAVMPLGSLIGTKQGLKTKNLLKIIINQTNIPVIIDAGIGSPSQALKALEIGADAILVNTAIAVSNNPVKIAEAFNLAVQAGEIIKKIKVLEKIKYANLTSPLTNFLT